MTEAAIDDFREEIERSMRVAGYWEAKVVTSERTGPAGASVLKLNVEVGPLFQTEIEVPDGLEDVALKAIPDVAEEEINPAQTDALAETIQERLQEQGYPLAEVTVNLETDLSEIETLRVNVNPGPMLRVTEVGFSGAARSK